MESNPPKFAIGDKVFAKIKGYVPWPATVDGIRGEQENKKYDVWFYGTHQLGVCREKDLKRYQENRATLGRPKHFKGFNKAVQEADLELGLVDQNNIEPVNSENESGRSKKRNHPGATSDTRSRSSSLSSSDSETSVTRGRGRPSLSRSRSNSPGVAPRGRRTRSNSISSSRSNSPRSQTSNKRGRGRARSLSRSREEDPTWKPYYQSTSRASPIARKRSRSLNGDNMDLYVTPNPKALSCVINPKLASACAKRKALKFLKNESVLTNAIFEIQRSLSLLKEADVASAMRHIDEFFVLEFNPLLLKKNPEAVDTIKKLCTYSGNFENWSMHDSAKSAFKHQAKIINSKACIIYDKFKGLFHIPEGKDFEEVFMEEVEKFNIATQGLPLEIVSMMTKDPVLA